MLTAKDRVNESTTRVQGRIRQQQISNKGVLVAEGDSWFALPAPRWSPFPDDVLDILDNRGYTIRSVASHGDTLENMAYDNSQLDALTKELLSLQQGPKELTAVLLSGGGNDIAVEATLRAMLNRNGTGQSILNGEFVDYMVNDRLRRAYTVLIELIDELCDTLFKGKTIPILIHGYGHAVPDGREYSLLGRNGPLFNRGPWLQNVFHSQGHYSLKKNTKAIQQLVDIFNDMLKQLEATHYRVKYVDVRPLLSNDLDVYTDYWRDELHPKIRVFKRMAKKFDKVIQRAHGR